MNKGNCTCQCCTKRADANPTPKLTPAEQERLAKTKDYLMHDMVATMKGRSDIRWLIALVERLIK